MPLGICACLLIILWGYPRGGRLRGPHCGYPRGGRLRGPHCGYPRTVCSTVPIVGTLIVVGSAVPIVGTLIVVGFAVPIVVAHVLAKNNYTCAYEILSMHNISQYLLLKKPVLKCRLRL